MKELIIIETNQAQQVKKLLDQAQINYKIYREPKKTPPKDIFANYDKAIKDKEREKEAEAWENLEDE